MLYTTVSLCKLIGVVNYFQTADRIGQHEENCVLKLIYLIVKIKFLSFEIGIILIFRLLTKSF